VAESARRAPFAESFQGETKATAAAETGGMILNHQASGFFAQHFSVRMQKAP
jgi:hypothetical protein